jgi:hypothetical protein
MVKSSEKGIHRPYHKKEQAMPYVTQRERASLAIEELERVTRPDYEPAGKR